MNIAELERQMEEKKRYAQSLLDRTLAQCAQEDRAMTVSERATVERAMTEARSARRRVDEAIGNVAMTDEIQRLTGDMTGPGPNASWGPARDYRSIGEQFVADENYRRFIAAQGHRRAGSWASPAIEAVGGHEMFAATLTTAPNSGGALVTPDVRPGVVMLPQPRLVMADLPAPGVTTSNVVEFMKEKTFDNAAAPVAQGAPKPESTLVFERASAKVEKLAHWIPVTEEMLEDYAQTRSIIDSRLRLGLNQAEDDQLLNGNGTSPDLLGFWNLPGLAPAIARGADTNIDAIRKQIAAIAASTYDLPDAIVINEHNWLTIDTAKDTTGRYLGDGPYRRPGPAVLWGLPVLPTAAIPLNSALVGAFRSASQIFRKGGVRIEASNSHSNFFVQNLVAVRGEERLALAVYRESAFGKVTGLN